MVFTIAIFFSLLFNTIYGKEMIKMPTDKANIPGFNISATSRGVVFPNLAKNNSLIS